MFYKYFPTKIIFKWAKLVTFNLFRRQTINARKVDVEFEPESTGFGSSVRTTILQHWVRISSSHLLFLFILLKLILYVGIIGLCKERK